MENYILISYLNDFIFCPRSIYFHGLYGHLEQRTYQEKAQIEGRIAHQTIDNNKYSTRKNILQGLSVYSDRYRLNGRIDIFDETEGLLIERKKHIKTIYDGYIFQLYAQYHCLKEMNYNIKKLKLYSMDTNKSYPIPLPEDNPVMQNKFEKLIEQINNFDLNNPFQANPKKCQRCIYANLCDRRAV